MRLPRVSLHDAIAGAAVFGCFALASVVSEPAKAQERSAFVLDLERATKPQWEVRLLGPAWSHHASTRGAKLHRRTDTIACRPGGTYLAPGWTAAEAERVLGLPAAQCPSFVEVSRLGGTWDCNHRAAPFEPAGFAEAFCLVSIPKAEPRWSSANPAIGIEASMREGTSATRFLLSRVRDSYGTASTMLAVGKAWRVGAIERAGGWTIDGGFVAGAWHRSELKRGNEFETRMAVVPFVLPTLSVESKASRVGVNFAVAPRMCARDRCWVTTTTVMAQVSMRIF